MASLHSPAQNGAENLQENAGKHMHCHRDFHGPLNRKASAGHDRATAGTRPRRPAAPRTWRCLLPAATALLTILPTAAWSQSQILESVKRNPAKAKQICAQLRQLNNNGISYTSKQATRQIADQEGLSPADAEVLTTYVVGLHCPDVR